MTANLNWYPMDNKAGAALQQRQTVVNSQGSTATALSAITGQTGYELPAAFANLGDHIQGNNNSLWVFVKASTTVTAGNIVTWGEGFTANNANQSTIVTNAPIGIAQFYVQGNGPTGIQSTLTQDAAQPGDYFWVATQGEGLIANVNASSGSANVGLFVSSAQAGSVQNAGTVGIRGLFTGTAYTGTGSNSTTDVYAATPMITST